LDIASQRLLDYSSYHQIWKAIFYRYQVRNTNNNASCFWRILEWHEWRLLDRNGSSWIINNVL